MPEPEVTVQVCTYRPGGIDILLAGMRDQTFRDFEVILVDHRYQQRHDRVMALAQEWEVPLIHVPEHRRDGRWAVTSSAFNTGFALARGRIIIMLVDYTYCPPGWLEAHLSQHQDGVTRYVLAPYYYHAIGITPEIYAQMAATGLQMRDYSYYQDQPPLWNKTGFDLSGQEARAGTAAIDEDPVLRGEVFDEISVFQEGLFQPDWLPRMPPLPDGDPGMRLAAPGGRAPFNYAHLKNESVPREQVYRLNGTDVWSERGGRMSIDTELGMRMFYSGAQMTWEPSALAHCINPRHGICRVMPFGDSRIRLDGRWSLEDCQAYMARRESEMSSGNGPLAAPAPYTMEQLAERLEPWRDPASHPIDVASLEQDDLSFFGREVWPDSDY